MQRILIMGAYGLLGTALSRSLPAGRFFSMRQGRGAGADYRCDPTDEDQVAQLVRQCRPDVVINLNAATNVDQCESDPQLAYMGNVRTATALAGAIDGAGIRLVHVSTDQVYDGPGPHTEHRVCPCNVYGMSKLAAEMAAATAGATVVRTNFVGRSMVPGRDAFTDWLVTSLRQRSAITVFDDVLFSALHVSALCRYIEQAIGLCHTGTVNVGCADGISKAQFALTLARRLGLDTSQVSVGKSSHASLRVRRPLDMRLDVEKMKLTFGRDAPTMAETLELVARDYDNA